VVVVVVVVVVVNAVCLRAFQGSGCEFRHSTTVLRGKSVGAATPCEAWQRGACVSLECPHLHEPQSTSQVRCRAALRVSVRFGSVSSSSST
jgi:hypothetical protein